MHTWPLVDIRRLLDQHKSECVHLCHDIQSLEALLEEGILEREELLEWATQDLRLPRLEEVPASTDLAMAAAKPLTYEHGVLPLRLEGEILWMAPLNPFDLSKMDELGFILGRPIRWVVADPLQIEEQLAKTYALSDVDEANVLEIGGEASLIGGSEKPPIIAWVDALLEKSVRTQATDIHLERGKDRFQIRLRIHGALHVLPSPLPKAAAYVVARLKHLAHIDVTEQRIPQDGRFSYSFEGRVVDFRLSTLPTHDGESLVLRVLDKSKERLRLDELGFESGLLLRIKTLLRRPYGLMLLTGPTGSGKTTTLYAFLEALICPEKKLLTVEDPIEYQLPGVTQVSVKNTIGLTFARVLRSALRHDPDVLMVGEIRDRETAAIAVQSALTGHMVFSTLHTGDALGAVPRLLELGVEPYLLAAALEAVMAQRLFLRLCSHCKETCLLSEIGAISQTFDNTIDAQTPFYVSRGCEFCDHKGVVGRQAVLELLELSPMLKEAISRGEPLQALRPLAVPYDGKKLQDRALASAKKGDIGIIEVLQFL